MSAPISTGFPAAPAQQYVLRLYITGQTSRSTRAIENLQRICDTHLAGRYKLEVVDIYKKPELEAQIVAAPTPLKLLPEPLRRMIGDLSDEEKVLVSLDLRPRSEDKPQP